MKFRRKSATDAAEGAGAADGTSAEAAELPVGPHDAEDLPEEDHDRIDLGSLLITPDGKHELRLQVDEGTGEVQSVMLAGPDGALEVRAFAAPRNGDLWADVRPQIAADMVQRGGTAAEREGRFGVELVCQLRVERPEGPALQPSRIIGINGSRWLLRATLLGRPALEPEGAGEWEDLITRVGVRRGAQALPVGEPLPLVLPDSARRVEPPS